MLSTCPNCLNQITHPDKISEVKCTDCGTVFAAFLKVNIDENTGEHSDPGSSFEEPKPAKIATKDKAPAEPTSMGDDFDEATNAFAEIRNFGEKLKETIVTPKKPKAPAAAPPAPIGPEAQPVPTPVLGDSGGEWLMTSGDSLQGHAIEEYLTPVSALTELVPGDNPMLPAFVALRDQAARLGANGVVAMRWSLSGDATRVLVTGTAVKCAKS